MTTTSSTVTRPPSGPALGRRRGGHSFDLTAKPEPLALINGLSWGSVGVLIFFSISGFLVARSSTDRCGPCRSRPRCA